MIMNRYSPNCLFSVQLTGKETSFHMSHTPLFMTMAKLGMLVKLLIQFRLLFYSSVSEEYWFGSGPK